MTLESALARFKTRAADTPETPGGSTGVSSKAASLPTCTRDTPDTPEKCKRTCEAETASRQVPSSDLTAADYEAIAEAIEERAAIREFEGGESREVAEREAHAAMRVFRILVAMPDERPPRWVTMIAPGCTLKDAKDEASGRFGTERVLDVKEHQA